MGVVEVAKLARVSTATVSRVINKTSTVKKSTRIRVLKAIKELNYHPNVHAQRLAGTAKRTLGMIVSNLANPFFQDIFRTLESSAERRGYEIVVANTDYETPRLEASIRSMIGQRPAGLAVMVSEINDTFMQQLRDSKVPVVVLGNVRGGHQVTSININWQRGTQRVVEYLHSLGHRRMAFVGHHYGLTPLQDRKKAFLETVKQYSREVEFSVVTDQDSPAGGRQATRKLLASGFEPTAVVCVNDFMALGVLRELYNQDLSVPAEISVAGYDNINLSEFCCPSLTTLDIPREKIGHLTLEALVPESDRASIRGLELHIEPELIIRESTGPVRRK